MKANIQNAASGFGQQYSAMMEQLQTVLSDGGDAPEDEMDEASDRMYADLEKCRPLKQAMRDAFAGGMQDLDRIVNSAQSNPPCSQQILTGLQTVSNDIIQRANLSAEYKIDHGHVHSLDKT